MKYVCAIIIVGQIAISLMACEPPQQFYVWQKIKSTQLCLSLRDLSYLYVISNPKLTAQLPQISSEIINDCHSALRKLAWSNASLLRLTTPSAGAVCFSPNGTHVAVGGYHYMTIWETQDWKKEKQYELDGSVLSIVFDADSSQVSATSYCGSDHVFHVNTFDLVGSRDTVKKAIPAEFPTIIPVHDRQVNLVLRDPKWYEEYVMPCDQSSAFEFGYDGSLNFKDDTEQESLRLYKPNSQEREHGIRDVDGSPDGQMLAVASYAPFVIKAATVEELLSRRLPQDIKI